MSIPALSEMERDALTEIVNIGVSRSAVGLRQMLGQPVILNVPSIEIVSRSQAARILGERETETLVVVRQDFSGAFCGRALLIFPASSSAALVQELVDTDLSAGARPEAENDALSETGNILINGCLGSMANMLHGQLDLSTPTVLRGSGHHIFDVDGPAQAAEAVVLVLYINFAVNTRNIRGYVALLTDMASLSTLRQLVVKFIAEVTESAPETDAR
jgi:chemotaxis protein CheC